MPTWSLKEMQFIKDNYKNLGPTKTAEKLSRPRQRVISQYSKLKRDDFKINPKIYTSKWPYKFPNLTPFELGYIAGFIDGEGSLTLNINWKPNRTPRCCGFMVQVMNTDPRPIKYIHKILNLYWRTNVSQGKTYLWIAGRQRVREFLENMTPYLIVKKEQAKIMLKLLDQHKFQLWTISDWKLVLEHTKVNPFDTHPKRKKRVQDLEAFIKSLESTNRAP